MLSGGGARAAYQVGVLRAIAALRQQYAPDESHNPFGILTGTSAGALNAGALASHADDFAHAVQRLDETWRNFHAQQVYLADTWNVIRTGARWLSLLSLGWALARWSRSEARAFLDSQPLGELIAGQIALDRVPQLIEQGHLKALAVSASSYTSGQHVTFYASATTAQPWVRSLRIAVRTPITHAHLLASSALPFIFPAQKLHDAETDEAAWYGDGSMRQSAPIAPAIHLGAQRVLVVGVGRNLHIHPTAGKGTAAPADAPSLGHIAGHALSSIFLDTLSTDIERLTRINHMLTTLSPAERAHSGLRPITLLAITPSQNIDAIAARHIHQLPGSIRALLAALGVGQDAEELGHSALASYLLFESSFTQELMALGENDTLARTQEVLRFMGWGPASAG